MFREERASGLEVFTLPCVCRTPGEGRAADTHLEGVWDALCLAQMRRLHCPVNGKIWDLRDPVVLPTL